ncbi:MAG: fibronectin type III domain-containing protein [Thermoplasmatota archaeon]
MRDGRRNGHWKEIPLGLIMVSLMLIGQLPFVIHASEPIEGIVYVGPSRTYKTINSAIENSSGGDTIVVDGGTYNETVTANVDQTVIMPSSDQQVIINGSAGRPAVIIEGRNVVLTGFTVRSGEISVRSQSVSISNLNLSSEHGPCISIIDSNDTDVRNVTIHEPYNDCIMIRSSKNVSASKIYANGLNATCISVSNSNNVNISEIDLQLNENGRGIFAVNTTSLTIDGAFIKGFKAPSSGIVLNNVTISKITNSNINVTKIGLDIWNSLNGIIVDSVFFTSGNGASGIFIDTSNTFNISRSQFFIGEGAEGISILATTYFSLDNSTMQIVGKGGTGMEMTGASLFKVMDNNAQVRWDKGIVAKLYGCGDGQIGSLIANIQKSNGSGICMEDSMNITAFNCMLTSTGGGAELLCLSNTKKITSRNSDWMVSGRNSTAVRLSSGSSLFSLEDLVSISGSRSKGFLIRSSSLEVNDITASVYSQAGEVINSTDCSVSVEDSTFYGIGADSLLFMSRADKGLDIISSDLWLTGENSQGMIIQVPAGIINFTQSGMEGEIGSGMPILVHGEGSFMNIRHSFINTTSGMELLGFFGAKLAIANSTLTGEGTSLTIQNTPDVAIENSIINSPRNIDLFNSGLRARSSDLSGEAYSLFAFSGSHARLLDSYSGELNADDLSTIEVLSTIRIVTVDRFSAPLPGVDLRIENFGNMMYQTPHFDPGSTDERTNEMGGIAPLEMLYEFYNGSSTPIKDNTTVEVFLQGDSGENWDDIFDINTSHPHTRYLISPDIDRPMKPRNFTAVNVPKSQKVFLNWDLNSDDTEEYHIYFRYLDESSPRDPVILPRLNATWTSGDLGPSQKIIFWVRAFDGTWPSDPTEPVLLTTGDITPPIPPSDIFEVNRSDSSITIGWAHPGEPDLAGFRVMMNITPSGNEFSEIGRTGPQARSFKADGLTWGTKYSFKVMAFDSNNNPSDPSRTISVRTLSPSLSVRINLTYSDQGPLAERPGTNCTVELLLNGSVIATSKTDMINGTVRLSGLQPFTEYLVRAYPHKDYQGVNGERSGYLSAESEAFSIDPYHKILELDLIFDYYQRSVNGTVRIKVSFGQDGERSGPVFGAKVERYEQGAGLIETKYTNADGVTLFIVSDLPFSGWFQITPPTDLMGDPLSQRTGYLGNVTERVLLTLDEPDLGTIEVFLDYYLFVPPLEELLILSASPKGGTESLDAPIIITFNQPVRRSSVEEAFKVVPALKDPVFTWSSGNRTMTVTHGDLLPETEYTVRIDATAESVAGTRFPTGYMNNTWKFTTTALPHADGDGGGDNTNTILIIALVAIIIVIIILVYARISSRREERVYGTDYTEYGEGYEDDFYDAMDDIEGEYPDDLADQMAGVGMPFEDEYDEEEYPEDELMAEEGELVPEEEIVEEYGEPSEVDEEKEPEEIPIEDEVFEEMEELDVEEEERTEDLHTEDIAPGEGVEKKEKTKKHKKKSKKKRKK